MQSQQSLILIETRLSFLQIYRMQIVQVIYIIFWPEGLLTFYDSDKGLSTIRLIFSKSNQFGAILRRCQIKLHSCRAQVQWVYNKGRNLLPKGSKVANTKATTYFFYIPTILINTHSRIQYRGCGNLATNTSSSMKSFTSFILTVSNSLRGSKLFEYLRLPVPLAAGRL